MMSLQAFLILLAIGIAGLWGGFFILWSAIMKKPWIEKVIKRDNFFPWPIRGEFMNRINFIIMGIALAVVFGFMAFAVTQEYFFK